MGKTTSAPIPGLGPLITPLDFSGGLVGGPIRPDMTKNGCPVFSNICLGESRRVLRTAPGWQRTTVSRIRSTATYALDNTKKWVIYDGEVNGIHGVYVTLVDWTNTDPTARTLSSGFNTEIPPTLVKGGWDPAALTYFVLSEYGGKGVDIGRMTPHEYPTPPVTFRGRTYFYDKYTVPCTLTPGAFRQSVPNRPTRRPILRAAASSNDCDILHAQATTLVALNNPDSGSPTCTVTKPTIATGGVQAAPNQDSTAFNEIALVAAQTTGESINLCYASKFFSFVEAEKPHSPRVNDDTSGYGVERGRYAYRVAYYVTCYAPPTMTTGAGLNDIYVTGSYTGSSDKTITVEVDAGDPAVPNTFKWYINAVLQAAGISMVDANDEWYALGTTGLKVRWNATTGHTTGNVWTVNADYLGVADAGFPSRVSRVGDPSTYPSSPYDCSVDITRIPKGDSQIGIGGRIVYRTARGPMEEVVPGNITPTAGGSVPVGGHKYVTAFVYPELGESPCSAVPEEPVINEKYPAAFILSSLRPADVMGKMFDSSNIAIVPDTANNDLTLTGAWGGAGDADWEIKIVVNNVGGGSNDYDTYVNGVLSQTGTAMSGAATTLKYVDGSSTGISAQWDTSTGHNNGEYWVINRSLNNVTRRIYRSDDTEKNTYHLVGEQDHLETEFTDTKSLEELGPERPAIQELSFRRVLTIADTSTTSDIDITRNYNVGEEMSKVPDAVNHTRVRFPFRVKDSTVTPGRILEPNTIAFFASASTVPTESVKEVPIEVPLQAGIWYYMDLPWIHGYFESYSYGLRQIQRDRTISADPPTFQIGAISIDRGKWGPFSGKWSARMSFTDEETKNESDSSDPSLALNLDDVPTGLELLPLGYRGFYTTSTTTDPVGLNIPPVNANGDITHNDLGIYLFKHSWGNDERGGGEYHLAVKAQNPVTTSATPSQYLSYGILLGNKDSKFLGDANSYSIGPSTPGETVSEDKATSQSIRKPGERVLQTEQGGAFGRTREDNAGIAIEELRAAAPLHDYKARGPATNAVITDYDRLVSGPESDFTVGTFAFTQYRDIAKYTASGISQLYPWMEGRKFSINSDDKYYGQTVESPPADNGQFTTSQRTFVVQKVINPTDPTNTWIVFGSDYSGETLQFKESYYGSTGSKSFKIRGDKSGFRYSTNTSLLSSDPDYWNITNYVPLGCPNDYVTPAHAGEYLLAMCKTGVYRTLLDRSVTDEMGPVAYPKPELIHGMPGTIAPRSVVSLPGGKIAWWTPDNRLAIGDASGFDYYEGPDPDLPMSERYADWLATNTDAEFLQFAHAYFDPVRQWYVIHFIATGAGTCPNEGAEYITTAPAADFEYKLTIDLRYGICWTGTASRMTHSLYLPADCVTTGQTTGKIITGDIYGFMHDYGGNSYVAAGVPAAQTAIVYTLTSVAGAVLGVSPSTLYNSNSKLDGVVALLETSSGVETVLISTNTASTITLTASPSTTPVIGDTIYVGGIMPDVHFREDHFFQPTTLESMFPDTYDYSGSTAMELNLKAYHASGNGLYCTTTTPAVTRTMTIAQLQKQPYAGMRRIPSKAIRPGFYYIQREGTPTRFGGWKGMYKSSESETGRDFSW